MRKLRQGQIKELARYLTARKRQSRLGGPAERPGERRAPQILQLHTPRKPAPDSEGSAERMLTAAVSMSALCRCPLAAASLAREGGPSHCSLHAEESQVHRDRQGSGLTHLTARLVNPDLAFRERKCLRLHTVSGLHFPESPGERSFFRALLYFISQNAARKPGCPPAG